jgi:hypothetical protein
MFICGDGNGPVSWFWAYTLIVPELLLEKIAPKIKIKITGKINPKNNPNLFLKYPRLYTLKSEKIRLPLGKL